MSLLKSEDGALVLAGWHSCLGRACGAAVARVHLRSLARFAVWQRSWRTARFLRQLAWHNRSRRRLQRSLPCQLSTSRRQFLRRLEADPVNACNLTMRAADKWESARFLSFCLAWSFFCAQTLSTLRPLAANASR